jgi:hypothetical protein
MISILYAIIYDIILLKVPDVIGRARWAGRQGTYPIQKVTEIYKKVNELYNKVTKL